MTSFIHQSGLAKTIEYFLEPVPWNADMQRMANSMPLYEFLLENSLLDLHVPRQVGKSQYLIELFDRLIGQEDKVMMVYHNAAAARMLHPDMTSKGNVFTASQITMEGFKRGVRWDPLDSVLFDEVSSRDIPRVIKTLVRLNLVDMNTIFVSLRTGI